MLEYRKTRMFERWSVNMSLTKTCLTRSNEVTAENKWTWTSYQKRKIAGCSCTGNAGNVSPPQRVSDPDMHHGTCVTHVPWCMPGSLTSDFRWSRWRGKRSRHRRRMRNLQFYVSGKRPMANWPRYIYVEDIGMLAPAAGKRFLVNHHILFVGIWLLI